jgi:rhodanese-related sulfurtransferase
MSKSKSNQTTGKTSASKSGSSNKPASSQKNTAKPAKGSVNLLLVIAAIAAVAIIAVIVFLPGGDSAGLPKEISVAQAKEKYDTGVYLLDVRQPEEWNETHVPGTTLIPLGELQDRVNELPKDKEIVVICRSGNRSQQGRDILLNAGFDQVTSMAGGVNAWKAAGYPTVTGP